MGSAWVLHFFSVLCTMLLYGAIRISICMYDAQYAIYRYVQRFCSIQNGFCGFQHEHYLVYGLDYYIYYLQQAAAAVLLPVATLCYLVTFYTFRAAIERVLLLYVDVMAIVYYIQGQGKRIDPGTIVGCLLSLLLSY